MFDAIIHASLRHRAWVLAAAVLLVVLGAYRASQMPLDVLPELSALATELAGDGIRFVGVGVDSQDRIEAFSRRLPVSYPLVVASATGAFLAARFGNSAGALPYTVVVDSAGRVHFRVLGRVQIDSLRKVLKSLDLH